jgi:hypothetical protein
MSSERWASHYAALEPHAHHEGPNLVLERGLPARWGSDPGDLYCVECRWLSAQEMLAGEGPLALDGVLRCPTHRA